MTNAAYENAMRRCPKLMINFFGLTSLFCRFEFAGSTESVIVVLL